MNPVRYPAINHNNRQISCGAKDLMNMRESQKISNGVNKNLLITIDYSPEVGGVARYLAGFVKENRLDVLTEGDGREEGIVRKKLLWKLWPKWLPLVFWSFVFGRRYKEIIISHLLPVGYAAVLLPKPYTVILHGLDIIKAGQNPWKKFWAKKILEKAKKIIVNSRATGELLCREFGEFKFEVEHPRIAPLAAPQDIDQFRKKYNLENKKIILTVGRLVKRKGRETLIKLMPQILGVVPEAVLLIAGDGPELMGLQRTAESIELKDKVKFLGAVKDEELPNLYSVCDIFVAPSLPSNDDFEGFGIVCLEAAYFGKPVIVSDAGGLPEAIEDGKTGYAARCDEELREKIIILLKDEQLARQMGKAGYERVKEKFLISN